MVKPASLTKGNQIRIISPSLSLANKWISDGIRDLANKRLDNLGLNISLGKHTNEIDFFNSSSIESRIEDIHDAFQDIDVNAIITAIGGFNSNQLLPYIDFNLIKENPKIFCGYSDITVLQNAILAKTGLITYYGPHYFSFGDIKGFDYTLDYFKKALFTNQPYEVLCSETWSDDRRARDQDNRNFYPHEGYRVLHSGEVKGTIWGGNLGSLRLLQGTEYLPIIDKGILFIEECMPCDILEFDRQLESLLQSIKWNISGLIIGKFEQSANIDREKLENIFKNKPQLQNIPIIANVNIGHVYPFATIPIGGNVVLQLINDKEYHIQCGENT